METDRKHGSPTLPLVTGPGLQGLAVGVTADRRGDEQAELLRRRGARVVHGPSVRIDAFRPTEDVIRATRRAIEHRPEVVVLTTSVGVRSWVDAAEAAGLGEDLVATLGRAELVVARGLKACGAAAGLGLPVGWVAPDARSDQIVDRLAPTVADRRVVVQRDGGELPVLADALTGAGGEVVDVAAYRWMLPTDLGPARRLIRQAVDGGLDALTFTSAAAVRNLVDIAAGDGLEQALRRSANELLVVAVGAVTAEAVADAGLGTALAPIGPASAPWCDCWRRRHRSCRSRRWVGCRSASPPRPR